MRQWTGPILVKVMDHPTNQMHLWVSSPKCEPFCSGVCFWWIDFFNSSLLSFSLHSWQRCTFSSCMYIDGRKWVGNNISDQRDLNVTPLAQEVVYFDNQGYGWTFHNQKRRLENVFDTITNFNIRFDSATKNSTMNKYNNHTNYMTEGN